MFRIVAKSLKTGILTEPRPLRRPAPVRLPGDRLRQLHGLRRVRRRLPHGRDPGVGAGPGSSKAVAFLRRLHPVPGVRHGVPGAGRLRRTRLRGRRLHARPAHARRSVRRRRGRSRHFQPGRSPARSRASASPRRACASASAAGLGARCTSGRWTPGAATGASSRSRPRPIRCSTWSASGSTSSRARATPTCSS